MPGNNMTPGYDPLMPTGPAPLGGGWACLTSPTQPASVSRGDAAASTLITYALSQLAPRLGRSTWQAMLAEIYQGYLWQELQQPPRPWPGQDTAHFATGGYTMVAAYAHGPQLPARQRRHRGLPAAETPHTPPLEPPVEPGQDPTYSDREILERSSVGQREIRDIAEKVTDADVAEVMARRRRRTATTEEQPPDYTLEGAIASGRLLSHRLMRLGRSYAGDGFYHRARICFQAAFDSGHPEAAAALSLLDRQTSAQNPYDGAGPDAEIPPAAAQHPDPGQLIERGIVLCNSGDEQGARAAFAQAVAISSACL